MMTLERLQIRLNSVRIYAYHGVMEQEQRVGGWYEVTLTVDYPFATALETDYVSDTLNYAELLGIVEREMAVRSRLLEHVAGRIGKAVLREFALAEQVSVELTKLNPPMGSNTAGATVALTMKAERGE